MTLELIFLFELMLFRYIYIYFHKFVTQYSRGVDVENAIKLAAADDGFVTYDELRENLRK
jgi:hypothetical protein